MGNYGADSLPPSTMGFGWKGTGAVIDHTFIVNCHRNRDISEALRIVLAIRIIT